jgi:hypothetical protein
MIMTTNNIQNLGLFLQALPVVTPFSTQQLLARKLRTTNPFRQ